MQALPPTLLAINVSWSETQACMITLYVCATLSQPSIRGASRDERALGTI